MSNSVKEGYVSRCGVNKCPTSIATKRTGGESIRELFLDLWTNSKDSPSYDKGKWKAIRQALHKEGIQV